MNKQKLNIRSYFFIGSMIFGLFFGAGNLIFPVLMGQKAGLNLNSASLGFIITAAGIPFLGVIAFGISRADDLYELSSSVNHTFALVFSLLLILTIGPLFALPRTGTVAFEISMSTAFSDKTRPIALAIFTAIFFLIALFFALRSSKILTWVGKILNPIFLVFLTFLIVNALINKMGAVPSQVLDSTYVDNAFFTGFIEGYNTMDALAALAFANVIIKSIRQLGVEEPKEMALTILKGGAVSMILMCIIYYSLSWLGATSTNIMPVSENGGIALSYISKHYFGSLGAIFLGITATVACLKTAIGLITACAGTFKKLLPFKITYDQYAIIFTIFTIFISNIGLSQIIKLSLPMLMLLYPITITLILLSLINPFINGRGSIYKGAIIAAFFVGIVDALNAAPDFIKNTVFVDNIITFYKNYIPFFAIGMGWVIPMLIGFFIGLIISVLKGDKTIAQ